MNRRLAGALIAMAVVQTAVYLARPVTSYRLLALGASGRTVGFVTAAFALLPLVLAIPLGRLFDRGRAGPLLTSGCVTVAAACAMLGVAGNVAMVTVASALLGVGHLAIALAVQELVARESRMGRHDQGFALMTAVVTVGQLVGPPLGGLVLSERAGLSLAAATSVALYLAAAFAAVAAVIAAIARTHASPRVARTGAGHAPDTASVRRIAQTRGVPTAMFASIASLATSEVFTAYLPVFGQQKGIDPAIIGGLLAVRAGSSIVTRIGMTQIVRRVGRLRVIALTATIAAVAVALIPFTTNTALLAVLCVLLGFGVGFAQPLSMAMVVELVPRPAWGSALALRLTGNRLGQVAMPAAAGLVAGGVGVAAVFWLLGGILVAAGSATQRFALAHPGDAVVPGDDELIAAPD